MRTKVDYKRQRTLKSLGFYQTYVSDDGSMEKWSYSGELNKHALYIHHEDKGKECQLYYGDIDRPAIFSLRMLAVNLERRGFRGE